MDYQALKALSETHPGWPGVSDSELADWVNAPGTVTRDRATLTANDLYATIDPGRFSDPEAAPWWAEFISSQGGIHVTDMATQTATALRTNFLASLKVPERPAVEALIPEQVSRGENAGLPKVNAGDVAVARTV